MLKGLSIVILREEEESLSFLCLKCQKLYE